MIINSVKKKKLSYSQKTSVLVGLRIKTTETTFF